MFLLLWLAVATLGGASAPILLLGLLIAPLFGWKLPSILLSRRVKNRFNEIDKELPALIDLLVVTVEAGIGFVGSLRMATQQLEGPLAQELRLALQEQNMGRSTTEAIQGMAQRADTPGVRAFARAIVQGETLGVSIGQILRNLAERDAQEAEGKSGGTGTESAGEDAVPTRTADLPGDVRRAALARDHLDREYTRGLRADMGRRRGTLTLRREDGRIVCENVKLADTYVTRTVGLLGRRTLPPGQGVVLRPSFSIHTFFMRFPIDVIFLDGDLVVMKIVERLPAFRTSSCRGAREVVELAAGECARRGSPSATALPGRLRPQCRPPAPSHRLSSSLQTASLAGGWSSRAETHASSSSCGFSSTGRGSRPPPSSPSISSQTRSTGTMRSMRSCWTPRTQSRPRSPPRTRRGR